MNLHMMSATVDSWVFGNFDRGMILPGSGTPLYVACVDKVTVVASGR
jgi:hypothetical protein